MKSFLGLLICILCLLNSWVLANELSDFEGDVFAYATLCEVAPGEWRAVWDSGTETRPRTRILFGKLSL